jgi:hypothetical protein
MGGESLSKVSTRNVIRDTYSRVHLMTLDGRLLSNVGVLAAVIEGGSCKGRGGARADSFWCEL